MPKAKAFVGHKMLVINREIRSWWAALRTCAKMMSQSSMPSRVRPIFRDHILNPTITTDKIGMMTDTLMSKELSSKSILLTS